MSELTIEAIRAVVQEELARPASPWLDSGAAAASTLSKNGSRAISAREPVGVRAGDPGWVPSQSSACGSPVTGIPKSDGIAVVEPHA